MAIIHDLPEAITGDVVWRKGGKENRMIKKKKDAAEREAMKEFKEVLGEDLFNLWEEYEARRSKEARILKELDKLEMAIQALIYGDRIPGEEFIRDAETIIRTPQIVAVLERIKEEYARRYGKR